MKSQKKGLVTFKVNKMYNTIILKNSICNIKKELNSLENNLAENGNLFCYVKNDYIGNEVKNDIFDLMEYCTNINLSYVNTIIVPESTSNEYDNIQYIIWFVKNKEKMFFNKDAIREKHIWKDVEWGKREKNYNPKGKDPGNVWIPTLDDGKGKITEHILLHRNKVYDRILDATIQENDNIFILSDEKEDTRGARRGAAARAGGAPLAARPAALAKAGYFKAQADAGNHNGL